MYALGHGQRRARDRIGHEVVLQVLLTDFDLGEVDVGVLGQTNLVKHWIVIENMQNRLTDAILPAATPSRLP